MNTICVRTSLPGPKSKALNEDRVRFVARAPYQVNPSFIAHAHGAALEDVDGNVFLDFAAGFGVVNVGHSPETVVRAIQAQTKDYLHLNFNVTPYAGYVELSKKLCELTPGSFPKKVFLANSGAEAVENAIKIARVATVRQAVVGFEHAFHGRTYLAMALTAKSKPFKAGFAPFPAEVYRAPFPYVYRWGKHGLNPEQVSEECFSKFVELLNTQLTPNQVAAVIIEPVLGEGGFVPAPALFLRKLRDFCTEHGIVLIADEIQTGFGRTGTLFVCEQLGLVPDLMTLGKGIAAGLPLSAVVGRAELMDAPPEGAIGGTYGGNPVACAAALAVLNEFQDGKLLAHAKKCGEFLQKSLKKWFELYPIIGDVRGVGPMQAIEFVKDRSTKEPYPDAAKKIQKHCYENGVIALTAGTYGNCVRVLIPLVMALEQLEEGLAVMEKAIAQVPSDIKRGEKT